MVCLRQPCSKNDLVFSPLAVLPSNETLGLQASIRGVVDGLKDTWYHRLGEPNIGIPYPQEALACDGFVFERRA